MSHSHSRPRRNVSCFYFSSLGHVQVSEPQSEALLFETIALLQIPRGSRQMHLNPILWNCLRNSLRSTLSSQTKWDLDDIMHAKVATFLKVWWHNRVHFTMPKMMQDATRRWNVEPPRCHRSVERTSDCFWFTWQRCHAQTHRLSCCAPACEMTKLQSLPSSQQ